MQSPLFKSRSEPLKVIFSEAIIKRTWKNKVKTSMRKHPVVDPIDYMDYHLNISEHSKRLSSELLSGRYSPDVHLRVLVEKSKGLCRQLVVPKVDDALVLQALTDAMYADIRGKEPTKKAFFEPEDHKFSKKDEVFVEPEYGSYKSWMDFQKKILSFSKEYKYIIVTDIANYYDTIGHSNLRNIISDLNIDIREQILDMLIFILDGLLWSPDYMPRVSVGLPQLNTDAPRVLAHSFLYEMDKYIDERCKGDFARYMDDIDIGVNSIQEAKDILKSVDLVLHARQVRLNSGKTQILTADQAQKHFCVRENYLIQKFEDRINYLVKEGRSISFYRERLANFINKNYFDYNFNYGNGEKILKRLLKVARRIGSNISGKVIYDILLKRPSVRDAVLNLVAQLPADIGRIRALHQFVSSGYIVDDVAYIKIANCLVDLSIPSIYPYAFDIRKLESDIKCESKFQFYAKLTILWKYGTEKSIIDHLSKYEQLWKADYWCGRLVGSMYPRFIGSKQASSLRTIISNSNNDASYETYIFHESLFQSKEFANRCVNFIKAGNKTKNIGTTIQRFMMAISAISNDVLDDAKKESMISGLGRAWNDTLYVSIAKNAGISGFPKPTTAPFPYQ